MRLQDHTLHLQVVQMQAVKIIQASIQIHRLLFQITIQAALEIVEIIFIQIYQPMEIMIHTRTEALMIQPQPTTEVTLI